MAEHFPVTTSWVEDPAQYMRVRVCIKCVTGRSQGNGEGDAYGASASVDEEDEGASESKSNRQRKKKKKKTTTTKSKKKDEVEELAEGPPVQRYIFEWQEKVYGPLELAQYHENVYKNSKSRRGWHHHLTRAEQDAMGEIEAMLEERNPFELMEDAMLFSYVDKDGYVPKSDKSRFLSTSERTRLTLLGQGVANLAKRGDGGGGDGGGGGGSKGSKKNRKAKGGSGAGPARAKDMAHIARDLKFKSMHIMTGVDMEPELNKNVADVRRPLSRKKMERHVHETALCSIRLFADDTNSGSVRMDMQPGFSKKRTGADLAQAVGELQRRIELMVTSGRGDAEAVKARSLPAELVPYKFVSKSGAVYEYTVENMSYDPADRDTQRQTAQMQRQVAAAELRAVEDLKNRVGTKMIGMPVLPQQRRAMFLCELVSAHKFQFGPGLSGLGGPTETAVYVQWHAILPPRSGWSFARDNHALPPTMSGLSQQCRPAWRHPRPKRRDTGRRDGSATLGAYRGSGHVFSQFAGSASGQPCRAGVQPTIAAMRLGRRAGDALGLAGSHAVLSKVPKPETIVHFAYPIELELLMDRPPRPEGLGADEDRPESERDRHAMRQRPQLIFQVLSSDNMGRHRLEGYGYVTLPSRPGVYELEVKTWKPEGTVRDSMASFFLGGARELDQHGYSAAPGWAELSNLNKYGFKTKSSGYLRLRVNMIMHAPMALGSGGTADSSISAAIPAGGDGRKPMRRSATGILRDMGLSGDGGGGARPSTGRPSTGIAKLKQRSEGKTNRPSTAS